MVNIVNGSPGLITNTKKQIKFSSVEHILFSFVLSAHESQSAKPGLEWNVHTIVYNCNIILWLTLHWRFQCNNWAGKQFLISKIIHYVDFCDFFAFIFIIHHNHIQIHIIIIINGKWEMKYEQWMRHFFLLDWKIYGAISDPFDSWKNSQTNNRIGWIFVPFSGTSEKKWRFWQQSGEII